MNQSGQAYSVFKLLIAAIIAVAILSILISIIVNIIGPGTDVATIAKQEIEKQVSLPATLGTSSISASFNARTNLAPDALVGNSGLTPEQICLHKGDFSGNKALEVRGNTIMQNGPNNLKVKVSVMCHKANALLESLAQAKFEGIELNDGVDGTCGCDLTMTQKCCVVILRYD